MKQFLFVLCLPILALAESHGLQIPVSSRHQLESQSSPNLDNTLQQINAAIDEITTYRSSGVELPVTDLEGILRLSQDHLQKSQRDGVKFFGKILNEDEKGVLLDNITIFTEYTREIVRLYQEDPTRTPGEIRVMAATNLAKRWKIAERLKKASWTQVNRTGSEISDFLAKELERRVQLVTSGKMIDFDAFQLFLREGFGQIRFNFEQGMSQLKENPALFIDQNLENWANEISKVEPRLGEEFKTKVRRYRDAKNEMDRLVRENIDGRNPEEIPAVALDNVRARSREIRQLEGTIEEIATVVKETGEQVALVEQDIRKELKIGEAEVNQARNRVQSDVDREAEELRRRINRLFQ